MINYTLIVIISVLIFLSVLIVSRIETFDLKDDISKGITDVEDNTHSDPSQEDRYTICPDGASFEDIATNYVSCCKLDSNKCLCNHPLFNKCKTNYLNMIKDQDYHKYLDKKNIKKMGNNYMANCIKALESSFKNYNNKYSNNKSGKQMVSRLCTFSNKDSMKNTCKNMCNIWKNECKGYSSDDSNCVLYNNISLFNPANMKGMKNMEFVKSSKVFKKN